MIKSMTGFGRSQGVTDGISVCIELKSVNHRYFEFYSRAPRGYNFLDEKLKSYVQSVISRGKVECYVQIEEIELEECSVQINHSLAGGYVKALKELGEKYGLSDDVSISSVAKYHDIFSVHKEQANEEKIWNAVLPVLKEAIDIFVSMRQKEGEKLKTDILSRCDTILENVKYIEARSPETVKAYQEKLFEKMKSVLYAAQIDEQRILMEAAIYSDKIAVDEETVRLRSHIEQLHEFMESEIAIGRKMDFLIQEFNREANTMGSKAQDKSIAKKVIDIKAEIEKIREQVQNIE